MTITWPMVGVILPVILQFIYLVYRLGVLTTRVQYLEKNMERRRETDTLIFSKLDTMAGQLNTLVGKLGYPIKEGS